MKLHAAMLLVIHTVLGMIALGVALAEVTCDDSKGSGRRVFALLSAVALFVWTAAVLSAAAISIPE